MAARRLWPLLFRLGAGAYDWMTAHEVWRTDAARLGDHLPPGILLDLGCGPGVSTLALAAGRGREPVIGLDLSLPMLRRARRADRAHRCAWLCGDALRLPFRSGSVGAAAGHSFLYLLPDRRAALAEILRVLRPGGGLALLEPSRQPLAADARSVAISFRRAGPRLAFTMSCWRIVARAHGAFGRTDLTDLLAASGFVEVRTEPALYDLGWIATARKPG